jgi:hypothetical protein
MLESFGMHTGGKEYRRLIGAFERIFGATIFFGTDTLQGKATMVQRCRFNFMREAQIWYSRCVVGGVRTMGRQSIGECLSLLRRG